MKHYHIIDLDTMGQGVAKDDGQITFIAKTLPSEVVSASIYRSKKNIHFAHAIDIISAAPERQDAPCPHYQQCGGCNYQHMDYQTELSYKLKSLQRHLRHFQDVNIVVHAAPQRWHYRNRIQLHYHADKRIMGLMDENFEPLAVHECMLIAEELRTAMHQLYQYDAWLKLVAQEPKRGHLELYCRNDEIRISVNQPYANGGFSQVFPHMNHYLTTWLAHLVDQYLPENALLLDLFGGDGNLSLALGRPTVVVDQYGAHQPADTAHQRFISQNLYAKQAIAALQDALSEEEQRPTCLIIDPPRSGLKNIAEFLSVFQPQAVVFIACDPSSFARDMASCRHAYQLVQVDLFDLFPATQHYETVGVLLRNDLISQRH